MDNNYCPLCDNELEISKKGKLVNSKTGKELPVLVCEDCDQSFVFDENKVKLAPYDFKGKDIKIECNVCGEIMKFQTEPIYLLTNFPQYKPYCEDCAIEFLRNWLRSKEHKQVEIVTKENVRDISQVHSLEIEQKGLDEINKRMIDKRKAIGDGK